MRDLDKPAVEVFEKDDCLYVIHDAWAYPRGVVIRSSDNMVVASVAMQADLGSGGMNLERLKHIHRNNPPEVLDRFGVIEKPYGNYYIIPVEAVGESPATVEEYIANHSGPEELRAEVIACMRKYAAANTTGVQVRDIISPTVSPDKKPN